MKPTADPTVQIEEEGPGYVRYQRSDGRRWEVHGVCNHRGDCLIGVVINTPRGPEQIADKKRIAALQRELGRTRIDSEIDVPVTPEFDTCCGADIFTYVELPPVIS